MPISCTFDTVEERDIKILRVQGELDFDVRSSFQENLSELIHADQQKLVVDLGKIQRMSSVYIGTMIDYANKASSEGKTLSCMMEDRMAGVCRDAGMDKVVPIVVVKS